MTQRTKPRWHRWLTVVSALGACLVFGVLVPLIIGGLLQWSRCSGDGGAPFSARSSPAGEFCADQADTWDNLLYLPGAVTLGAGVLAVAVKRPAYVGVGIVVAVLVVAIYAVPYIRLDGDCSEEQLAANAVHDRTETTTEQPQPLRYDCQTYN